jgi:titin
MFRSWKSLAGEVRHTARHPRLEVLEDRCLLNIGTITVTTNSDAPVQGKVTLRQAIDLSNNDNGGPDTIAFKIAGNGKQTITLGSDLPDITRQVIIDGYTQPGATKNTMDAGDNANLLIEINGNATALNGLTVTTGNCIVRGLIIDRCLNEGIELQSAGGRNDFTGGNRIEGNFIGTDENSTAGIGNGSTGIFINRQRNNIIGGANPEQRNVISGNGEDGVQIFDDFANAVRARVQDNQVVNNIIGLDQFANAALPNGQNGVHIVGGDGNIIGPGNFISGQRTTAGDGCGVLVEGDNALSNMVRGNVIGLNQFNDKIPNDFGVDLVAGAADNLVGGRAASARNIISGNTDSGVQVFMAAGNRIEGNYIGTDPMGNATGVGNGTGVKIVDAAANVVGAVDRFGNPVPAARNIITDNGFGVRITQINVDTQHNLVAANYIGINADGTAANNTAQVTGVLIDVADMNTIGGGNVISNNQQVGVEITATASENSVFGNKIGTSPGGTAQLGFQDIGVLLSDRAADNEIGLPGVSTPEGVTAGQPNVISGNLKTGVKITDKGTSGNKIKNNFIGTDVTGMMAIANDGDGVLIDGGEANEVGGILAANLDGSHSRLEGNVISGNNLNGVKIVSADTTLNKVQGNFIGVDNTGKAQLGNGADGVLIENSTENAVGGNIDTYRNVISSNGDETSTDMTGNGVHIKGGDATKNRVEGNYIGVGFDGQTGLGNVRDGVFIDASPGNIVGGYAAGRNVIGDNGANGVEISGAAATKNMVQANYVGTQADGQTALLNGLQAVLIDGAGGNVIGGTVPAGMEGQAPGNILFFFATIRGRREMGVLIRNPGADANTVSGNLVRGIRAGNGPDQTSSSDSVGIEVENGANNLIEHNRVFGADDGIALLGAAATGNLVLQNYIGTDPAGDVLGNNQFGVLIDQSASNNELLKNVIAYNGSVGVREPTGTGNLILTNSIFSNGPNGSGPGGIDVAALGVTTFNLPQLSLVSSHGTLFVQVTISGTPNTTFMLQFFSNAVCDPTGFGQGQTYIGQHGITTNASGMGMVLIPLPPNAASLGMVTATATNAVLGTSEFSNCLDLSSFPGGGPG